MPKKITVYHNFNTSNVEVPPSSRQSTSCPCEDFNTSNVEVPPCIYPQRTSGITFQYIKCGGSAYPLYDWNFHDIYFNTSNVEVPHL